MSYVITMFPLVSRMNTRDLLLYFARFCARSTPQNNEQKPTTTNFDGFHNHFPLLTMSPPWVLVNCCGQPDRILGSNLRLTSIPSRGSSNTLRPLRAAFWWSHVSSYMSGLLRTRTETLVDAGALIKDIHIWAVDNGTYIKDIYIWAVNNGTRIRDIHIWAVEKGTCIKDIYIRAVENCMCIKDIHIWAVGNGKCITNSHMWSLKRKPLSCRIERGYFRPFVLRPLLTTIPKQHYYVRNNCAILFIFRAQSLTHIPPPIRSWTMCTSIGPIIHSSAEATPRLLLMRTTFATCSPALWKIACSLLVKLQV